MVIAFVRIERACWLVLSSHVMSCHAISSRLMTRHVISSRLISSHLLSSPLISSHPIGISSHLLSSHRIPSYLIPLYPIASHLISSHLTSSHLISYHLQAVMLTQTPLWAASELMGSSRSSARLHGSLGEKLRSSWNHHPHYNCSLRQTQLRYRLKKVHLVIQMDYPTAGHKTWSTCTSFLPGDLFRL